MNSQRTISVSSIEGGSETTRCKPPLIHVCGQSEAVSVGVVRLNLPRLRQGSDNDKNPLQIDASPGKEQWGGLFAMVQLCNQDNRLIDDQITLVHGILAENFQKRVIRIREFNSASFEGLDRVGGIKSEMII